ncbi:hypothetical protein WDZ92_43815, partial [Nostoc sp. NIES-2111]
SLILPAIAMGNRVVAVASQSHPLIAARLYQGQTTNMRTPGGGFAPVFVVEAANASRRTEDSNCRE